MKGEHKKTCVMVIIMKIKSKIKYVWHRIFEDITVPEYISWWVVRVMLLCSVIFAKDKSYMILDSINMLAAYAMSFLLFIAPRKSFIARLNLRCQHIINLLEILGTFMGHLLNVYAYVSKYDRILHFISGFAGVIAGYYIYKALEEKDGKLKYLRPTTATFASVSFSFMIMVLWEIQEFFSDFFIGSQNQGYNYAPGEDDIFFKVFGHGANGGVSQFPLWDTMMDIMDATLTTAISAVVLYVILVRIKNKAIKKEKTCHHDLMLNV